MFLRGSHGRLALPNELPSQNKDITYLLTYLLYTYPVHHLKACYQAQQFTSFVSGGQTQSSRKLSANQMKAIL